MKAHVIVTGSLGYAQNYYSFEHPKDGKRKNIGSLRAWAAVHPAAEGDGLQGPPGEWEQIPLTKLWQSPQSFLGYRYLQLYWNQYNYTAVMGIQNICPCLSHLLVQNTSWSRRSSKGIGDGLGKGWDRVQVHSEQCYFYVRLWVNLALVVSKVALHIFLGRSKMCRIQQCELFPDLLLSFTSSPVFWMFMSISFKIHSPVLSSQKTIFLSPSVFYLCLAQLFYLVLHSFIST